MATSKQRGHATERAEFNMASIPVKSTTRISLNLPRIVTGRSDRKNYPFV
jgi:hypothetical protein